MNAERADRTLCASVFTRWSADLKMDRSAKTRAIYMQMVNQMLARSDCAKKTVGAITRLNLNAFVNDTAVHENTRRLRLAAIRSFYKHASAYGALQGDISALLRVNPALLTVTQREVTPAEAFTEDEYRRISKDPAMPQFWRWASAIGYWLGLRLSDVCHLEWASIGDDSVLLYPRKTGRQLVIPLNDPLVGGGELLAVFNEMFAAIEPKETYCFPARVKSYPGGVFNEYRDALLAIGITGKTFHGWRHAFKLRMAAAGKPIADISRLMGHSDVTTTMLYGRSQWASPREASVRRFTARASSPPPAVASAPPADTDSAEVEVCG